MDLDDLNAAVGKWAAGHSPHVAAAVDLLVWHDHWLRHGRFVARCVHAGDDSTAWINWREAREMLDEGLIGSSTELAVLDFAIDLGTDRYRFSQMGQAHRRSLVAAVTQALG